MLINTPDAIRDLVKRLRVPEEHEYYTYEATMAEAAAALEQLLSAVEEAETVMKPLAGAALDEWNTNWPYVSNEHLRAASEWRAKHGAKDDN